MKKSPLVPAKRNQHQSHTNLRPVSEDANIPRMQRFWGRVFIAAAAFVFSDGVSHAQTPSPAPDGAPDVSLLSKRIDELHLKIDALSQQLLKMQQQLEKPGRLIGEGSPAATPAAPSPSGTAGVASASVPPPAPGGTSHTVARGETLTSIAKHYKVTVDELQRHNQIEDGRKLQAGQTIGIPTGGASASPTVSPSPKTGP